MTRQIQIFCVRAEEMSTDTNKAKGGRKEQAEHSLGGAYANSGQASLPPTPGCALEGQSWFAPQSHTAESLTQDQATEDPPTGACQPLPRACCKSVVINRRDLAPLMDTGQY